MRGERARPSMHAGRLQVRQASRGFRAVALASVEYFCGGAGRSPKGVVSIHPLMNDVALSGMHYAYMHSFI